MSKQSNKTATNEEQDDLQKTPINIPVKTSIMGRPTKYTVDFLEKCEFYLNNWDTCTTNKIPTLAGLAMFTGTDKSTIWTWSKDSSKPDLTNVIKRLTQLQEQVLLDNGLDKTFSSVITKLVLHKHDYSETQIIETHDKTLESLSDDSELAKRLAFLLRKGAESLPETVRTFDITPRKHENGTD